MVMGERLLAPAGALVSTAVVVALAPLGCAVALAASASAFFLASLARRLRSASRLPEATRPGFLAVAGFVFGESAVTRTGAGVGAGVSSGIVSSGCVAMVYIVGFKICKVRVRFV